MSKIKMNIEVDISSKHQLAAFSKLFNALSETAEADTQRKFDNLEKELSVHNESLHGNKGLERLRMNTQMLNEQLQELRENGADMQTPDKVKNMEVVSEEVPGKPLTSEKEQEAPSTKSKDTDGTPSTTSGKESGSKKSTTLKKKSSAKSKTVSTDKNSDTSTATDIQDTKDSSEVEDLREPLRVLLNDKVDKHRAEIKAELGKYDAKSITNLNEKHHRAFMDFMEALD